MSFIHLHTHTKYSLLDGVTKIEDLVKKVKDDGQNAVAITDHGNMYGVIELYKTCKEEGIKPILGCEVYVAPASRFDKKAIAGKPTYYHLVLLAKNNEGYKNLCKIVSAGWTDGFYFKPRVDHEILEKHHEGIICLSACLSGEVPKKLLMEDYDAAKEAALFYQNTFGKENFFIELQDHGLEEQKRVNPLLIKLSKDIDASLVVTNDAHYLNKKDAELQDVAICIGTARTLADKDRMSFDSQEFYVKSEAEMRKLFPELSEAYDNTQKIADMCNVEIEFGKIKLPYYEIPSQFATHLDYFKDLCHKGMIKRYGENCPKEYWERLKYETGIIDKMGFISYYLIVWDFINWAKTHNIPVGPGRGSGAGSIAAYAIGITNLDPMQNDLIFERFLNPERISMPDFDVDFCYFRRQEVIEYVTQKYGKEKVSQIITFMTDAAKRSIADVGRVYGFSYAETKRLSDMVPNEQKITLSKALELSPEFKKAYDEEPDSAKIINMAMQIEGLPRNTSKHAAGVLIADKDITEYAPVMTDEGSVVIQFTMTTLEELGLVKMDFLGLRTLTVIKDSENTINANFNKNLDMNALIPNDSDVYSMLATDNTIGVFQFESGGMKSLLKQMFVDVPSRAKLAKTEEEKHALGFECFERLVAAISLYRPGPMKYIPDYIAGMNYPDKIKYDCPEIKPILQKTYGVLVYQEQVQEICKTLAGYSLGRADLIRRAMGKKKKYIMDAERQVFLYGNKDSKKDNEAYVPGCLANGIAEDVAICIWDKMAEFASYAFNKSHAASYAYVSYQTAWLKKYYAVEFMAALLTSVIGDNLKLPMYINACQKTLGIKVLPPNVNRSNNGFSSVDNDILFGLESIRNVGNSIASSIIEERKNNGNYTSLYNFCYRLAGKGLNKKSMEGLIYSGALDFTGFNRNELLKNYPVVLEAAEASKKDKACGQFSLFDIINEKQGKVDDGPEIQHYDEFPINNKLIKEHEFISLFLSGHPLDSYSKAIDGAHLETLSKIITAFNDKEENLWRKGVTIPVFISAIEKKITKKGTQMAIITIQDIASEAECLVFENSLMSYGALLQEGAVVLLKCRVDFSDKLSLICSDVYSIPKNTSSKEAIDTFIKSFKTVLRKKRNYAPPAKEIYAVHKEDNKKSGLYIKLSSIEKLCSVVDLLKKYPGSSHVYIFLEDQKRLTTSPSTLVDVSNIDFINNLKNTFGEQNVVLK